MAAQYITKFIKEHIDAAVQSVTAQLEQLIDDAINNFDIEALFTTILRKATDIHTYIDFEPGLGPQTRLAGGSSPRSGMSEFEDAQEEPDKPKWQRFIDIMFEVDQQYPNELKYISWGLISRRTSNKQTRKNLPSA